MYLPIPVLSPLVLAALFGVESDAARSFAIQAHAMQKAPPDVGFDTGQESSPANGAAQAQILRAFPVGLGTSGIRGVQTLLHQPKLRPCTMSAGQYRIAGVCIEIIYDVE
jgi:hypothetical protein